MRQKLKDDAKNGKTFSLRDIIAMKNDYLDDKTISTELDTRFRRPIPTLVPPTLAPKNHWLPVRTTRTTSTTRSSVNLMDLIARRRQQSFVSTTKMTTTAPPAVRIQNAYAAQRATVLEKFGQKTGRTTFAETTTDRFRTRVVPFTTASPRTFKTRQVPFGMTTRAVIKATILTTTSPKRAAIPVPLVATTTAATRTTMNPARAAFLSQLAINRATTTRSTSPKTTITTTTEPEVNTKEARQNFLEKLQAMKSGRTNAPVPETESTTQSPGSPNSSRMAFFKRLKEQMAASNSTSLAKEIEAKRQFFLRMMQKKQSTTVAPTTIKLSKNEQVEQDAIQKAKQALMSRLQKQSKPTEKPAQLINSARASFLRQLQEKKALATKMTTTTTMKPMTTTGPLTRDAATKERIEFLKRLQTNTTPKTTKSSTTTTTSSARVAFLQRLSKQAPETSTVKPTPVVDAAKLAFLQRLRNQKPDSAPTEKPAEEEAPFTISSSRLAFLKRLKAQRDSISSTTTAAISATTSTTSSPPQLKIATPTVVPTFAPFQTQAPQNDNADPQLRAILCKFSVVKKNRFYLFI